MVWFWHYQLVLRYMKLFKIMLSTLVRCLEIKYFLWLCFFLYAFYYKLILCFRPQYYLFLSKYQFIYEYNYIYCCVCVCVGCGGERWSTDEEMKENLPFKVPIWFFFFFKKKSWNGYEHCVMTKECITHCCLLLFQLIRIHSRNSQLGWTRQKVS